MSDDKWIIYPFVNGKKHALRVPPNITLDEVISHLEDNGAIEKGHTVIRVSVEIDSHQPLNSFGLGDKSRIDISTSTLQAQIEDLDPNQS